MVEFIFLSLPKRRNSLFFLSFSFHILCQIDRKNMCFFGFKGGRGRRRILRNSYVEVLHPPPYTHSPLIISRDAVRIPKHKLIFASDGLEWYSTHFVRMARVQSLSYNYYMRLSKVDVKYISTTSCEIPAMPRKPKKGFVGIARNTFLRVEKCSLLLKCQ